MEKPEKLRLLEWIKKLHHHCIFLNSSLISFYQLDKHETLTAYDYFELPIVAVKHKVIPKQGIFECDMDAKIVNYHIHGTGITLLTEGARTFFEYYPKTSPERKPILGLSKVLDFIRSVKPDDDLCYQQIIQNNLVLLFEDKSLARIYENFFEFYLDVAENSKTLQGQQPS